MICISRNMGIDMMQTLSVSTIRTELFQKNQVQLDLLRADLLHPQISGNKWYKLKYNLAKLRQENKQGILSFGGAYSNHLHALAYAGHLGGFKTCGIVRGEKVINPTLQDCAAWGMDLHFISRSEYRKKEDPDFLQKIGLNFPGYSILPEGANNQEGIQGCSEIIAGIDLHSYDQIACAVGTGATLSGLIQGSAEHIWVTGFAVMKNAGYLVDAIKKNTSRSNWALNIDYHFGGFGKVNDELMQFMNYFEHHHHIALDFVYNAKMLFGLFDHINKGIFNNCKILAVHTGGLQGNRSVTEKKNKFAE